MLRYQIPGSVYVRHSHWKCQFRLQYIPRNMHTVFALLCFVVVIHWLIFPYPSGLLHWHCGNLTMNMGKCIMWIHYEWLHNHNKAKHNKTVCKFLGIYSRFQQVIFPMPHRIIALCILKLPWLLRHWPKQRWIGIGYYAYQKIDSLHTKCKLWPQNQAICRWCYFFIYRLIEMHISPSSHVLQFA